ncbi:MAG: GHMP kinase [Actinomycetota bacterium]
MIISRTPLRISFVGGGSDISTFYNLQPGAVVSTTIRKYIYVTVNKKFDNRIRASYSITEIVDDVNQLKHDLIRECLKLVNIDGGIEITSISDITSRGTGLGSSSSYTVGLLNALHAHKGEHASAERLAQEACKIEIEALNKPIGKQDQYAAAYGGLNYTQFNPDESVFIEPIICKKEIKEELERSLLLFYTGIARSSDLILSEQKKNMETQEEKNEILEEMVELAREMKRALTQNNPTQVGELLHKNWILKKKMAQGISSPQIDKWYDTARQNGATGGKILGAGGGGFLLICAPRSRHEQIRKSLSMLRLMPFTYESQGSKIIYVEE